MKGKRFTLVIPSLNPDDKLISVVESALKAGIQEILLVDDGSREDLRHYFTDLEKAHPEVALLSHERNLGKGEALKTAFRYFLEHPGNSCGVVTADGDGQHRTEDILACGEAMAEDEGAVVLGCRDFSSKEVPFKSRFGNRTTSLVFRLFFGMRISDTQTGLRAIPAQYLPTLLEAEGSRYEYETNVLLLLGERRIPYKEVKITTLYYEDNKASHFRPIRDSLRIYGLIFKYAAASLASSLVDLLAFFLLGSVLFVGGGKLEVLCSTVVARVISSAVNFGINRRFVFENRSSVGRTILRYFCLAVPVMLISWLTVYGLSRLAGVGIGQLGRTMIKIPVDTLLFLVSFRVQRRWVFAKEKQAGGTSHEKER